MANTCVSRPPAPQASNSNSQELKKLVIPDDESTSDSAGDEETLYVDQDDAHSIFQPALSPVATRLTSPKTPAAEKAAAMERLPAGGGGGLFSVVEGTATPSAEDEGASGISSPRKLVKSSNRQNRGFSLGQLPSNQPYAASFPSPWQSGPRTLVVQEESGSRPALSGVFSATRHRRSSSGGAEAFKRIREALPNITLPTNFFSNLTSPTFFSATSSQKSHSPESRQIVFRDSSGLHPNHIAESPAPVSTFIDNEQATANIPVTSTSPRPLSGTSKRPQTIRRSTSDESMLYHSLSRVSSFGDDDRWEHIREQTNSRLKAIKDSIDMPNFRRPQLPDALKRNSFLSSEAPKRHPTIRLPTIPQTTSTIRDSSMSEFDRVLESLTGDIVVMGGYRGSILRSTKTNRQVWVPVKVGLNIRKVNLEVGLDPEDEERMEETIYASGMLQNIGPVDISKRLFKRLRECENAKSNKLRVWDYGWDWRLSPHLLSRKLISFLEQLPSNQAGHPEEKGATVIAHSLGGLITRHAVNHRPDLFAGVVFAGTPQRCINILGPIRNGDAVLLNEKVLTAQVTFSLRTTFVFLPEDGYCFINKNTGEEFPVDFYNPEEWAKYSLSPCIEPALPAHNVKQGALGSFLNLSNSLPTLPGRSRGNSTSSDYRPSGSPTRKVVDATQQVGMQTDRTLAPQMGNQTDSSVAQQQQKGPKNRSDRDRNIAYLKRTLGEARRFRAELAHRPDLRGSNSYPPMAVIYGKDTPTVYGAHVTSRDGIACSDAYDNLLFQSGDGVVLAREAMLPPGYDVVKGGRISTDRGHITMLGDLAVVGKALDAIFRGRKKGIGMGPA